MLLGLVCRKRDGSKVPVSWKGKGGGGIDPLETPKKDGKARDKERDEGRHIGEVQTIRESECKFDGSGECAGEDPKALKKGERGENVSDTFFGILIARCPVVKKLFRGNREAWRGWR